MYIKLGNTNIKYRSGVDDYMIFSEVPDSQLSYEKPILVRTKDELDVWFGRNFESRKYFDELLKKGVTLYLYKPIEENDTSDIDDYIDIETYYIFPEIFLTLPMTGDSGYAYYLKTLNPIKHYYRFGLNSNNKYTWIPLDNLDGYSINQNKFYSIYDLPKTGESGVAYFVENIPAFRYWYVYEDSMWREVRSTEELNLYTPYKGFFANSGALPTTGTYRYQTLSDKSWWKWENSKWVKTVDKLQEFPIYFDTPENLPSIGNNYRYDVDETWYIWLGNSWTPEDDFPQNLDNISNSLNNRDTLIISKPDSEDIPYSYPEFRLYEDNHLGVFSRSYDLDFSDTKTISDSDLNDINLGYKTLAFKLSYTSDILDQGYIIIKSQVSRTSYKFNRNFEKGYNYCFWSIKEPKDDVNTIYFSGERIKIITTEDLITAYTELGYKTIRTGDLEYLIYTDNLFDFTEFYTYENIKLLNSFDDTENILTGYILDSKEVEFYSKTIGSAYEDSENNIESLISVKIENPEYERYRVTLSRFDYSETYEGALFPKVGEEERLDNIITKESKLVSCNFSGLKNFLKLGIYQGVIGSNLRIEYPDFTVVFKEEFIGQRYLIKVEKTGYEEYTIYLSVGEISETYSGKLFSLQEKINSKPEIFNKFEFKNLCNRLRTGTYYLRRGKNENQTREMYIRSLGCLFDTQIDNIWPDFFLVPDIKKYINKLGETESYYSEYKDIFLKHAKDFNCQFLIQNNEPKYKIVEVESFDIDNMEEGIIYKKGTEYKIYDPEINENELIKFTDKEAIEISENGGDFIYNYTGDTSNYLVYFFKPMSVFGNPRPAYYVFLDGLLKDIYSASETTINYDSPLQSDPYELDKESISESLEKYKSNFLINNNHVFYYKKYFNGSNCYSTVWMRFVLGKIYRELNKNKWSYLSQKSLGIIETEIKNTLWRIQNKFSIVSYISLVKVTPTLEKNYLEVTISTYISDLMNNNMTLNITVNYNELNTD